MSETNQNELQLRIMYPPKCGYCYYRFFISTNAMSIIVITPGYNLIPIQILLHRFSYVKHCQSNIALLKFIVVSIQMAFNGVLQANERAKDYLFSLQFILILKQNTL